MLSVSVLGVLITDSVASVDKVDGLIVVIFPSVDELLTSVGMLPAVRSAMIVITSSLNLRRSERLRQYLSRSIFFPHMVTPVVRFLTITLSSVKVTTFFCLVIWGTENKQVTTEGQQAIQPKPGAKPISVIAILEPLAVRNVTVAGPILTNPGICFELRSMCNPAPLSTRTMSSSKA